MVGTLKLLRAFLAPFAFLARRALVLVLSIALVTEPAMAQSILRDAETEAFLRDISRPIIAASGLRPEDVQILLVNAPGINAFVAGGQIIYVHSGMIEAADNANQIQGVIAHELGHITGGHIIRYQQGASTAAGVMILSLLLGAAAMAAGGGEAGVGVMALGQQVAMGKFMSFLSTQESSADQAGVAYLSKAGLSGKGSIAFFKKIQNLEMRYSVSQDDSYMRNHPLTGTRIATLENLYKADPAWDKPANPVIEDQFQRIKAKLSGFVNIPKRTLIKYPESDKSVPARYARVYAWHKSAWPDRANTEIDALLKVKPEDPYFLELKGQVLLESGKPEEALDSLRKAVANAPDQPLISALLGHALISTEKAGNFAEAKHVLRAAIGRDNSNPDAWYQLGIVYDREGDHALASLATAERYNLEGNSSLAFANARLALAGVKFGTPDCLRAQDIAMASRAAIESNKKTSNKIRKTLAGIELGCSGS